MHYCRECGVKFVSEQSIVCVKCGTKRGVGNSYCQNCGALTNANATVCLECGVALRGGAAGEKSKMTAGLFGIFLGAFGVHNFYLGYTKKAIIQLSLTIVGILLSCIVVGVFLVLGIEIWGLVEGIYILSGKIDCDANGRLLRS